MWNPQSQNEYAYVHNNPLIFTDPSGHKLVKDTNQIAYLENLAYCLNPNDGDAIWASSQLEQRLYYYDDEGDRYKMIAAVDSVFDLTPNQAMALWNSSDVTSLERAQLVLYFGKQALGYIAATARLGASGAMVRIATTAEEITPSVNVDVRKFSEYIFKDGATHGKDVVFRNLGYSGSDSEALVEIYVSVK
jgi:hypothetical protein